MPPPSIVSELQLAASGGKVSVAELLRKAFIVASKLKIDDMRKWIDCELQGYARPPVPNYRVVSVEVLSRSVFGCQEFRIRDPELAKVFSHAAVRNPIAEIENAANKEHEMVIEFSREITERLTSGMMLAGKPFLRIPGNHLTGMVDNVRTVVLKWALRLEENGIRGEGMSFSDDEKRKASETPGIHIAQFNGILGNANADTIQIGEHGAITGI